MPSDGDRMAAYFETYRATVTADLCDHLGHMNIQHYVAALNDGAIVLVSKLGLTPDAIRERRIALAAAHMESDFLREVQAGEEIVLESAVARVGGKSVTILHRLTIAASGAEAMTAVVTAVLMDLDTRKALPLPDDIRASAMALAGALS